MGEMQRKPNMNIGLLAHVDAGKTTLSEAMLYAGGELRRLGRVDHGDAFLDTDIQEKERGITIFSKQAMLKWKKCDITRGKRHALLIARKHAITFDTKRKRVNGSAFWSIIALIPFQVKGAHNVQHDILCIEKHNFTPYSV